MRKPTVIAAREHSQLDIGHIVVRGRRRLRAAERARGIGTADLELVVICGKRLEPRRFDLDRQTPPISSVKLDVSKQTNKQRNL